MEQEKQFEAAANGQSGETQNGKREGRPRRYRRHRGNGQGRRPEGNAPEGQERRPEGNPAEAKNREGGFNRKNGGKPFRKFTGKPNDKPGENRGSRPFAGVPARGKARTTGKVLVAYYSWSGVTEKAARKIAEAVKGNSYRILPVNAYSSIYALCVAKGGMEKASGARPEIKGSLPDCSRYDKIAIGFPIWWFSCPMIIHSFLEKVKLDGKTVYPFCTSKTSGPRNSAADIRKTVPNATVKECLDANKIDSMSEEDIKKWLEM